MKVADTNQHYNLDAWVFELFLDPMRKYSCGLYESADDSLETAQQNKLHYVADRLALKPGHRLLDLGCGWGSLILFMAENYKCESVGISPAPNQRDFVVRRAAELGLTGQVSFQVGHAEEVDLGRHCFDAISMLGSIVHMPDLSRIFAKCWTALKPGGRLYVSESCYRNAAKRAAFAERGGSVFVRDAIFGWGDMRPLSELVRGAEDAGFTVTAVDDLTAHYHRTIEDWRANAKRNSVALDDIETGMSAKLIRYFETANAGWGFTTKHYALTCQKSR